jgi:RNA polymerase sigma-70 factor (ECF subfamily)
MPARVQRSGEAGRSSAVSTDLAAALAADLDGSFERVVQEHGGLLFGVALRISGSREEAEDAAQDALVSAYRALSGYPPERIRSLQLRPWLVRIAINAQRSRLRARRRRPADPLGDDAAQIADEVPGPAARAEHAEERELWRRRLAMLPERQRLCVVLHHVEGLTYEEVADALAIPPGTVKSHVHRGLRALAGVLADHPHEVLA